MDGFQDDEPGSGTSAAESVVGLRGFRQKVLLDERGVALRLTWHPEAETCVLSIWREGTCKATFRLPVSEVADLSGFLSSVLGDWTIDVVAERAAGQLETRSPAAPDSSEPARRRGPREGGERKAVTSARASLRTRLRRAVRALGADDTP